MAVLCREFDISRKTGYKIFNRYKDCGLDLTIRQGGPGIDPAQLLVGGAIGATLVVNLAGSPGA